jgi:hypothetical protein
MAGGKFDNPLVIIAGCLQPVGPLELEPGEEPLRVDAWVTQEEATCAAVDKAPVNLGTPSKTSPGQVGGRWTTAPDSHADHAGNPYKPGQATARAVVTSRKQDGTIVTFFWEEVIDLEAGQGKHHPHP